MFPLNTHGRRRPILLAAVALPILPLILSGIRGIEIDEPWVATVNFLCAVALIVALTRMTRKRT